MGTIARKQTSFRLREDLLQVLQKHAKKANNFHWNYDIPQKKPILWQN